MLKNENKKQTLMNAFQPDHRYALTKCLRKKCTRAGKMEGNDQCKRLRKKRKFRWSTSEIRKNKVKRWFKKEKKFCTKK